jgi:hypothetical protein
MKWLFHSPSGHWILSLLLVTPAFIPHVTHYFIGVNGLVPTGFILDDSVYYMANAREYFDGGGFRLTYGNPFSPFYDTPRIYFQPLTLLLGIVWYLTGWDPGIVFTLIGCLAAVLCARVALALYREVVGLESWPHWLGLLTFFWGGGVLAITGFVYNLLVGDPLIRIFRFDPESGWWFLNFGRNLVLPTEAVYHALFFASILFVFKRHYKIAAVFALLLSISHPFTGIELLTILCAWTFVELYLVRTAQIPRLFFYACCALFVLHLTYYLVYLKQFSEHAALVEQWSLPWILRPQNFLPACLIVGILAFRELGSTNRPQSFLALPHNRLLMIWFLLAFLLANHQILLRPVQPIHFDRGYIWTALFLIGGHQLIRLFSWLGALSRRWLGGLTIALFVAIFVSDNALWLGSFPIRTFKGIRLTQDQAGLLRWIDSNAPAGSTVLSQQLLIGYLTPVYTSLRSWWCHPHITPNSTQRRAELESLF